MAENQNHFWNEAIRLIPMKWRAEFCCFMDDGKASPEFLRFLDSSPNAQKACELICRNDEFMRQVLSSRNQLG